VFKKRLHDVGIAPGPLHVAASSRLCLGYLDLLRIREEALRRRRGLIRRLRRVERQRLEAARSSWRSTWPQPTRRQRCNSLQSSREKSHTATRRGGEI